MYKTKNSETNLAPESKNIRFDGTARGTVIVKSSDAAIDLEGRDIEKTTFEGVDDSLTEGLPVDGANLAITADDGSVKAVRYGNLLGLQGVKGFNSGIN